MSTLPEQPIAPNEPRLVRPRGPVVGDCTVPSSKSDTNRALVCAALAEGESTLCSPSRCEDTDVMRAALGQLGIVVADLEDAGGWRVIGGRSRLQTPIAGARIDVRNAGTAMRFLTGLVPFARGEGTLDGSARMRARPIAPLVDALQSIGARVDLPAGTGCPPVHFRSTTGRLPGGAVRIDVSRSSQYLSALLLAAPAHDRSLTIAIDGELPSRPYVALTLGAMRRFGVVVEEHMDGRTFTVPDGGYRPATVTLEADASSAGYVWAAAALLPGSRVCAVNLPGDTGQADGRLLDVLAAMGARVRTTDATAAAPREVQPPADGVLCAAPQPVDMTEWPDAAPTLAAVAAFAAGTTTLTGVANLRVKECDRLAVTAENLRRIGIRTTVSADGDTLAIDGQPNLELPADAEPPIVEVAGDHRMAMAAALTGLKLRDANGRPVGVRIPDPGCVSKSFPEFWATLDALLAQP